MTEHYAGLATQIRDLERRLKEIDTKKANPSKVKEITDTIKNLKDMLSEKKQKKEDRRKKKEEAAKAEPAKAEATVQTPEVVKESAPAPTEEVTKESETTHFAVDAKVEPTRGTPGSWGTVIRSSGTNGDPLCYVKWAEGPLKSREEYGAYYESDLRMKVEKEAVSTDYVPREQLYHLESDLKSNQEQMIKDLEEERKTALEKGEAVWAHRLEQKIDAAKKVYEERFGNEKHAEDENGSGGTNKLKVVDQNPAYDKDPQEKSIGYGGDRAYSSTTAPNRDDMTSLNANKDVTAREMTEEEKLSWDARQVGEFGKNRDGSPRPSLEEVTKRRHEKEYKQASLKFADLDLNSIEKRWALYVDGRLAIRTLTRSKAERIAKERFPEQVAAGKYEIKREDHTPVTASLDKQAIHITVGEKLFVVTPLAKTADNEYAYDVTIGANNQKLFKITSKDEMGQEHLTYVIGKELSNKKEAASKCVFCGAEFSTYPEYAEHKAKGHKPEQKAPATKEEIVDRVEKRTPGIIGKLLSNLAFLKKGSFVSIVAEDKAKGQIKFASLDGSLRGWAPINKFAAMEVPEAHLIDHEGHKDEILAESGKEILVTCPANSVNVEWRAVEAPPATPEALNPDVTSAKKVPHTKECNDANDRHVGPTEVCICNEKKAAGCDQCNAAMINGVFCHETGCPNRSRADREIEIGYNNPDVLDSSEDFESDIDASLHKQAHIRHEGDKWIVYNHDYTKKLGTYDTEEAAQKRLRQIEYFKHQGSLKPLSKKEATGEADQDYDHAYYDAIVADLAKHGYKASHKEFDKYQGVYIQVSGKGVNEKFWTSDVYFTGERTDDVSKYKYRNTKLVDIDGNEFSANAGDYWDLPKDKVLEGLTLVRTLMNGETEEIENPKASDLLEETAPGGLVAPDTFTYKPGTEKVHVVFTPESDPDERLETMAGDGAGQLLRYLESKAKVRTSSLKRADQEISLEQQVQSFRDRMSAVTERLSNPPQKTASKTIPYSKDLKIVNLEQLPKGLGARYLEVIYAPDNETLVAKQWKRNPDAEGSFVDMEPTKTADLETTQDLSNVDVKDLSSAILHTIDLLESKVGTDVSADPELHPMLEDLENKVYEIEMKLGIKPNLPEHEKLEPEHKEIVKEIGEEPVEKESDMSNVPPSEPAPQGFRYAWEPTRKEWIMVADPSATGTGTGGTY